MWRVEPGFLGTNFGKLSASTAASILFVLSRVSRAPRLVPPCRDSLWGSHTARLRQMNSILVVKRQWYQPQPAIKRGFEVV